MARPTKQGLEYYPNDVDIHDDDKIALISSEFHAVGEAILWRLLCKIYKNGYYYCWGGDERLLFCRWSGGIFVPNQVEEVVKGCLRRSVFDDQVFKSFGILTSRGIQKRYLQATTERKEIEIIEEFWLIEMPRNSRFVVNPPINIVNPPINKVNQPKSTQSKVKESKVKESTILPHTQAETDFQKFQKWITDNAPHVSKMKEPFTIGEFEKLKLDFDVGFIQDLLMAMHNYKPLLQKNVNANLTFRNWAKRENHNGKNFKSASKVTDLDEIVDAVCAAHGM